MLLRLPKHSHPLFGRPWIKPIAPNVIDREEPISVGMIENFTMQERIGKFGNELVSNNTAFTFPGIERRGQEMTVLDSGSSSNIFTGDFIPNSSPVTILIRFNQNAALVSDQRIFNSNSGSSAIICRSTAAGTIEFLINSLTNDRVSHSITYNAGEDIWIGGSWAGPGTALKVITFTETDGFKITVNGATSTGTYTNSSQQFNTTNNMGTVAAFRDAVFWDREVSEVLLRRFVEAPYRVLKPANDLYYFPPAATGATALPVQDINQGQTIGNVSLTTNIVPNDIDQAQNIDNVLLTINLDPNELAQAQDIDNVGLTLNLVVDGLDQPQAIDNVALGVALAVNDIAQGQTIDNAQLTINLVVNDTSQGQTIGNVSLRLTVVVNGIAQTQTLDNVALSALTLLVVQSLTQAQLIDLVVLGGVVTTSLNGEVVICKLFNGEIQIQSLLTGEEIIDGELPGETTIH